MPNIKNKKRGRKKGKKILKAKNKNLTKKSGWQGFFKIFR